MPAPPMPFLDPDDTATGIIRLATEDGTPIVTLDGMARVSTVPIPKAKRRVQFRPLCPSTEHRAPGRAVANQGTNLEWRDLEFATGFVTLAVRAQLQTIFDAPDEFGLMRYSPDDGTTWYLVTMMEDGFEPTNYRYNGELFCYIKFKLAVLALLPP